MNRRGFLAAMLAAAAAPAIVRAASLMPGRGIIVPSNELFRGELGIVRGMAIYQHEFNASQNALMRHLWAKSLFDQACKQTPPIWTALIFSSPEGELRGNPIETRQIRLLK